MANAAKAMTLSQTLAQITAKLQAVKELIAVGEEGGGNIFQRDCLIVF